MENREKQADSIFNSGFNCAQAVITAFADKLGLDKETTLKFSSGFGAGMGGMQKTCGAVTGAIMVIGCLYGKYQPGNNDKKIKAYKMIKNFSKDFISLNGSTNCLKLIECDLGTEEGQKKAKDNNVFKVKCAEYVKDAVRILEEKYL